MPIKLQFLVCLCVCVCVREREREREVVLGSLVAEIVDEILSEEYADRLVVGSGTNKGSAEEAEAGG